MKTTAYLKLSGSLLAIAATTASPAMAQNSWTGGSSGYSGNNVPFVGDNSWHNGANWSEGVPTAGQDVSIGLSTIDQWTYIFGCGIGDTCSEVRQAVRPGLPDQVWIFSGNTASASNLDIGFSGGRGLELSGGSGAGDLTNNSILNVGQNMVVGSTGSGTFQNLGTTTVGGIMVVGQTAGATGTMNMAVGSSLTSDGLVVGAGGQGLLVSLGTIDVDGNTAIGQQAGASGELRVGNGNGTGITAVLTTDGNLTVGENGDGVLRVYQDSTAETDGRVALGVGATGDGVARISGEMLNHDSLTIAQNGLGLLSIAATGLAETDGRVVLGADSPGRGFVNVNGVMQNGDRLIVGDDGFGRFNVFATGTSNTVDNVTVAGDETGVGLVIVSGGTMNNAARLDLGREGEGYLVVDGGGEINNSVGVMATERDATAYAVVNGANSLWDNRESLTLARDEGASGVLVINNGGTVRINGGNGTLTIAEEEGATGILNIGAMTPVGEDYDVQADATLYLSTIGLSPTDTAARAPGTLDAAWVQFGAGAGTVNFKHTGTQALDYRFQAGFVGDGTVNHYEGFTVLDGDSTDFTGDANVLGGIMVVNNVLAGDVTVGPAGTLRIGHEGGPLPGDGTKGDVVNDIVNNGLVQFNRADTYVYDSVISGIGNVEQMGSGTTVITGENTYTGLTTVNNGTLQLGDGGTTGSIDHTSGVVVNANGTLAFNRSDFKIFDRQISGTGQIRQIGSGTTRLTEDSSAFTGDTHVDAGILSVNGILGGMVHVHDGGTLEGIGTVGTTIVHTGGTIAPGNSIGTLTVNGDLTHQPGSFHQTEVMSTGDSDLLYVTGTATLTDEAFLNVTKLDAAPYELEHRYTILTADGGVTGDYILTGDTSVSTFYRVEDRYDANNVYLDVTQHRLFQEAGSTINQINAATAAQELKAERDPLTNYPTNPLFRAIAYLPDDETARYAFDQISGELHASAQSSLLENERLVRDATGARIRSAFGGVGPRHKVLTYEPGISAKNPTPRPVWVDADEPDGLVLWGEGFGSWGKRDGDGNAARFDDATGGVLVGADLPVRDLFRIGIVGGYSYSEFDVDERHSVARANSYRIGLYGGAEWRRFNLHLGGGYAWHDLSTRRDVAFPGFSEVLTSDYDAHTAQVYGDLSYTFHVGNARVEPFGGLAYAHLRREDYRETGGVAALNGGDERSQDMAYGMLGLRGARDLRFNGMDVTARGMLAWRHAFDELRPTATHAFSGSSPFTVYGAPVARDVALVEAGFDAEVREQLIVGLSYSGLFGDDVEMHGLRGNLNWRF